MWGVVAVMCRMWGPRTWIVGLWHWGAHHISLNTVTILRQVWGVTMPMLISMMGEQDDVRIMSSKWGLCGVQAYITAI